ncbi:MAG: COX15/CtaA family protein [Proteobacteria bacterium]|nr:COX15/CtaA family protein [Pseudomonadota bacterium]
MTVTSEMPALLRTTPAARSVGLWLLAVAGLIALMVVIGGLTRLTGSGLSITEWKPVTGALPPLSEQAWAAEFAKYKIIPQYRAMNSAMTLSDFKAIYWWEWTHRFLGRFIGFAFAIPFLWFAWRGSIARAQWPRFVVLFLLGGLQGAVGWWMVESGLETRVSVSQYRLAIHLGVAIVLLAAMIWTALDYLRPKAADATKTGSQDATFAFVFAAMVYVQMLLGAFVAGLHAGLIYNSWPSMDGRVFPQGAFFSSPWWINFFENAGLVQFDHRIGAYIVAIAAVFIAVAARRAAGWTRIAGTSVLHLTALQLALGITTLLLQAPVWLSALHQTTAVLLFSCAVWYAWEIGAPNRRVVEASAN